jgi:glutaredoxin
MELNEKELFMMKTHKFGYLVSAMALVISAGSSTHAQTVYRIVGADGKVTFSDKPPVNADQGKIAGTGVGAGSGASSSGLPFELRQVVSKYPVTLYTASKCGPCDTARSYLVARGVPFTERTVNTPQDAESLQRISGETSLPFITVGNQRLSGFTDVDLNQYLDAAGYPKASVLPAGFRNASATPLVPVQKAAEPAPKPIENTPAPAPASNKNPDNPTGIVF